MVILLFGYFFLLQITCQDKSLLLYSKSQMEAITWFRCIRDAIRLVRVVVLCFLFTKDLVMSFQIAKLLWLKNVWRILMDWDLKFPDGTLYGGRKHTMTNFSFSF